MNFQQKVYLGIASFLFVGLIGLSYVKIPIKASEVVKEDKKEREAIVLNLDEMSSKLKVEDKIILDSLLKELNKRTDENQKLDLYKRISGTFYKKNESLIAGYFAEKVAMEEDTKEAWFIAGSSYLGSIESNIDQSDGELKRDKSLECLEKAKSKGEDLNIQIQEAIVYTQFPLSEEPMKGILALRELNKEHPENVEIIRQLVRLAIKTNQWEKALERLEQWKKLEPKNKEINCLIADVYHRMGRTMEAKQAEKYCNN